MNGKHFYIYRGSREILMNTGASAASQLDTERLLLLGQMTRLRQLIKYHVLMRHFIEFD